MPFDAGALDGLEDGAMREVKMDGAKVLVIRDGDAVNAIGGTCPHAGAPLASGVLHGGRVICPWHKAAFCARTGALLEPPAVDSVTRFAVQIERGRIMIGDAQPRPGAVGTADARRFLIIGAGAAGALAAQTLRQEGFAGRVLMLDRANRVPYDRTLLSKYYLSGEKGAEKTPLQSQAFYRDNNIERLTADVTHIDPVARVVTCSDGAQYQYDAALLATGAEPARLPVGGAEQAFVLRSRDDAEAILARAEQGGRAVILGAGFIGMEAAASLRERGLDVTVVARESAPFEKQLGAQIGSVFTRLHQQRGVAFRFGEKVAAIDPGRVVLGSGELLPADFVVIGAGVKPAVPQGVSTGTDGGVTVDRHLRIADGLYAAGDIARFPLYGQRDSIRVEHWRVAQQQGSVAAMNMLGRNVSYDSVPVFWTIQYMKRLDYVGHAESWDEIVVHGDLSKPAFIAYYVKDGLVAAAAGLDRDADMAALIALLGKRRDWAPDALGDSPAQVLSEHG